MAPIKETGKTPEEISELDLDLVVGGSGTPGEAPPEDLAGAIDAPPPPPGGEVPPPPPPGGDMPPPPPPGGDMPPPPPAGDEMPPPPPPGGGDMAAPPPHPDGYVNEFIAPLFEGLEYNAEGPSSWTLPVSADQVDLENSTFTVSADQVGSWEGGIPPEAKDNGDGTYTIHSWPMSGMVDNGDGTVTLEVGIPPAH